MASVCCSNFTLDTLDRHFTQSNYSSSLIGGEHNCNVFSELPTCSCLMLNYLQLRWSFSLTDVCLIECWSSSWWGCCLAPCRSLPALTLSTKTEAQACCSFPLFSSSPPQWMQQPLWTIHCISRTSDALVSTCSLFHATFTTVCWSFYCMEPRK